MLHRMTGQLCRAVALTAACVTLAHAHHVMDYAAPVTALDGLLSGLGHPIIGVDHLLFIAGAGVLAARLTRGYLMPLFFVVASISAAALRAAGVSGELSELWIAGSLVALGALMLATRGPGRGACAGLFLAAGALHGYALAEAIVGAESTPLVAYFAGLTVIQCAIALAAWWVTTWLTARRPQLPVQRLTGAVVGATGLFFAALAAMG